MQKNKKLLMTMISFCALMAMNAHGQVGTIGQVGRPATVESRLQKLENEMLQSQRKIQQLNQRINLLEGGNGGGAWPPPQSAVHACMLVDSGYSKTFLGIASTKLDAEFKAKKECEAAVHASYCTGNAVLKCDNNMEGGSFATKYVCIVTDSGYGKSFRGEGVTALVAEASAKAECQKSVHASYCGNVKATCEAAY